MIWSPDIYDKAWQFATLAHKHQTYGKEKTYLNHIGSVVMEIMNALQFSENGLNSNLAIQCALLHDIIEDTAFTFQDLKKDFGVNVASGVEALTKNENIASKKDRMIDSLIRIKQQPYEIWMVKMADRVCNLQKPPKSWEKSKIIAYREEGILIYKNLKEADEILASRLSKQIDRYSEFV